MKIEDDTVFIEKLSDNEQTMAWMLLDIFGTIWIDHNKTTDSYHLVRSVDVIQIKREACVI